ncbi:MAG: DUF1080 domain-containing protein [Candidatus Aminicenantes bacterium]|nr:DUF1080 domain-containing protein [Candidatus Aminicenantes bacterium]
MPFSAFLLLPGFLFFCSQGNRPGKKAEGWPAPGEVTQWAIHDPERPLPPVIVPGPAGPPVPAPSDAIVLFDGDDLSAWEDSKGGPPRWKVESGYMEVVAKTGSIRTKETFGDCQLHVEWAVPEVLSGEGQGRGNSGVFLMNTYEVQVLDSYENKTYADGMAGAIYGQYPPLVNACRKPGEWQAYAIIFRRPRFDAEGKVLEAARMTVFHNGILIHDHVELAGPTTHKIRTPYMPHPDRLPLSLQDHGNPVRFRNIWIRPLE